MPRILIFHEDAPAYVRALRARLPDADVIGTADEATFRREVAHAEVVVALRFPVDVLAGAPRLRWIQITSAGTEFLEPARNALGHRVVTNGRGLHAAPIADYVMAAMVMLHSDFAAFFRNQQARHWQRRPVGVLAGKTLGVIGVGSIGQEIARRGAASAMDVIGLSRSGTAVAGIAEVLSFDRLHPFLARCDFVVLAVPATVSTRAMLGAAEFAAMKRSAYLINIARGAVVDEPALVEALSARTIAGACLDVFAEEPLPESSPLWTLPNVIVTPHIAGMRSDYEARFMDIFVGNLDRYARGEPLANRVDFERGY